MTQTVLSETPCELVAGSRFEYEDAQAYSRVGHWIPLGRAVATSLFYRGSFRLEIVGL